jgi:hypothetical protein
LGARGVRSAAVSLGARGFRSAAASQLEGS